MTKMARNDYASDAIVPVSNETMKRVNTMNTPYSVQQLGLDKHPEQYIPVTSENLDAIVPNTRVAQGNIEKVVKTVNLTVGAAPLISVVLMYLDDTDTEVTETWTKAELLASGNVFLFKEV